MDADVNGITIHYEVAGPEGAPWVTFSHSIAADLTFWRDQAAALAGPYRVLSYDTRGHGASGVGAGPYSLEMLADDVIGLWDALGIEHSHFVGLSLGGMTGMVLGLEHAARLDRLVIANALSEANSVFTELWDQRIETAEREGMAPLAEASIGRWFTEGFVKAHPDTVAAVVKVIEATPPAGYAGAAHAIRLIDMHRHLGAITCPTLFIAGTEDGACPAEGMRADHDKVAGSQYLELSPAAHISNLEQPVAFNDALLKFLGG